MSSTVENFHYVVYKEFEKQGPFADPTQNLFGFKKVLQSTPEEIGSAHDKVPAAMEFSERHIPDNQVAQTNFTELAELITSATGKQGREGNVNVYNKCVFFVNSYNNGDLQDEKSLIDQLSGPFAKAKSRVAHCSDFAEEASRTASFSFDMNDCLQASSTPEPMSQLFTNLEGSDCRKLNSFGEDPIVVSSGSDDESHVETAEATKLYFVDKHDLKPILTPNVMPGVYKMVSPTKESASKSVRPNVYRGTREKNGTIMTAKDFESSYVTARDIAIKTDDILQESRTQESSNKKEHCQEIGKPDQSSTRTKNELIYRSPVTKKKIIYRIVRPAELQLNIVDNDVNIQLGNPTFVQYLNNSSNHASPVKLPTKDGIPKRPRGRPRKISRKRTVTTDDHQFPQIVTTTASQQVHPLTSTSSLSSRTRCGRMSKLPQFIESNFKVSGETPLQVQNFENANDNSYKCNNDTSATTLAGENVENTRIKRERNVPPEYRCNVCNKIYLGKNKMLRHFGTYPEHFVNPGVEEMVRDSSLYTFLVKKVQQPNLTEDQRITLLLNELTDFVNQLQLRRSQLVTHKSAIYFVNSVVSKVLGAAEGHYGVDLSALSAPPPPVSDTTLAEPPPARLDYNLSISLDDTIADAKLNLTENIITSDDSLLRTVDDLVKEGMKSLTGDDAINRNPVPSVINYDHASDNAVEAVNMKETQPPPMLDLSLDLFQFNSN
ncbi:uncharacterized protein LOC119658428 isoform X2 [Hermetia illucens]|uniref:uncharacterized protein LOC119658428 isoform X2 n=1 Tax=Hermetia illucens TaxID=343691 RepID=UPI0018CC6197|nr:uncharacterized protein LOC119658428 isoform X2 [Hermetia illucens]